MKNYITITLCFDSHKPKKDGLVTVVMSCTHYHCFPFEGAFVHFSSLLATHQEEPIRSESSLVIFCIVFSSLLVGKKRN